MRILLLGLNYAPEVVGIGPYNTDLAEHLVTCGHDVTVATTFPYYPHWIVDASYRNRQPYCVEDLNGVRVFRFSVQLPGSRRSTVRRVIFDSSFAAIALAPSIRNGRVDLVIGVSPPLQVGVTAWIVATLYGARLWLHLQDIVPDAALAVGMMKEGAGIRIARHIERFVYSRCDRISVVSEGFRDNLLAKGVPARKLCYLPNWVDTKRFLRKSDLAVRAKLGAVDGETLVVHSGNMGAKQGLETVVDAAQALAGERIVFVIAGDGNQRRSLEMRARHLGLRNLRFVSLQADFPATLAAADILVLSQKPGVIDSVAPSKLLGYMASGKPVVAAVHESSEAGKLIARSQCGVLVRPGDPLALADAIRDLNRRVPTSAYGSNGREYVGRHFERARILHSWSGSIDSWGNIGRK